MSSYLSSLLSAFGGRGGAGGNDHGGEDSFNDFEDAGSEENTPLNTIAGSGKAAAGAASKAGAKSQDPSVHWLSVQTTETDAKVVVEKAAGDHLAKLGAETALNLVSIFGGARQGKSFLMNLLASAGDDRLFKISNSKDPCTQGVDLSRKVLTWSQFHHLDDLGRNERRSLAKSSSEPRPHVAFVDVEGQGDRDITYDANLTCPIVLASKAVIFNWKDSLQKDKLLNMLGIVARAAANVAPEEEDGEDGGVREPMFGHLHICFRDWTYEGDRDSVYKTLFTREQSNAPDAVLRNQIRDTVTAAFESITVWLLPPPVDRVADLRRELVASDLSQEFKAQVTKLRHALAEQLKQPKHFAGTGKVLTGPKIASLVPQIVATLNSGARVLPKSAYAALIESEVARVQATYLRRLQRALQEAKRAAEAAPLATPALQAKIQAEVHTLQRDFDRWLRTLGDDAAALAAAGAFHEHCGKGGEEVVAFNRAHFLPAHVAAAGREAKAAFDARFSLGALEPRLPVAPERLAAEHTAALGVAEAGVRAVVAGEPDADALLGRDALPALRTHAELALTKAAAANQAKLAGVAAGERAAYEQARGGFEADFFARLQALKAGGRAVSEGEYLAAFDAALAAARRKLGEGLRGELTPPARKEELEGFLVAAAEACKREQGVLYQLDCTEKLMAASLGACAMLVGAVAATAAASDDAATEAALRARFEEMQQAVTVPLEAQLAMLAATDAGKAACRELWQGVGEAAWTVVKAGRAGRAAAVAAAGQQTAAQQAAKVQEAEAAATAAAEKKAAEERKAAATQLAAAEARAGELEARVGVLEGEKKGWAAERAELQGAVAAARQEAEAAAAASAAAAAAAAAAVTGSASKKRKAAEAAEEEEEEAPARPAAKSRRKGGKAAAAEEEEEEEGEEASGMEVDAPVVKEEEQEEEAEPEAPAPAAKGKKKAAAPAASKGRAGKGKGAAASAAAASTSPGAGSKLAKAKEEERKRIEESMTKRITRAGRGK